METFAGGVEINIVEFFDAMAMSGRLAIRQDGMGQFFADIWK